MGGLCVCALSRVQLFETAWTVACQAALSMEFPKQECWSGLPFPSPGDLPRDWTHVCCLAGGFFTTEPPGKHKSCSSFACLKMKWTCLGPCVSFQLLHSRPPCATRKVSTSSLFSPALPLTLCHTWSLLSTPVSPGGYRKISSVAKSTGHFPPVGPLSKSQHLSLTSVLNTVLSTCEAWSLSFFTFLHPYMSLSFIFFYLPMTAGALHAQPSSLILNELSGQLRVLRLQLNASQSLNSSLTILIIIFIGYCFN